MAWLTGLADKAETLLNKIDQNTAAVLSKENNNAEQTNITWTSTNSDASAASNYTPTNSPNRLLQFIKPSRLIADNKDEISSTSSNIFINESSINQPTTPSPLTVEYLIDTKDSMSEYSVHSSDRSSPLLAHTLVVDLPNNISDGEQELPIVSKGYLENDIHVGNISTLENETVKLQKELLVGNNVEQSVENKQNEIFDKFNNIQQNNDVNLAEKYEQCHQKYIDSQKQVEVLEEKLHLQELENVKYLKYISDLEVSLERCRVDLQLKRENFEQYKARALKTLQEKDKLIAQLQDNSLTVHHVDNSAINSELSQLQQECNILRAKNQQLCEQFKIAKEELDNADLQMEETSRKITQTNYEAHEIVLAERKKRIEAEEDARIHLKEVRALKDELSVQHNNWTMKFRKQESEISRLRSQLSAISTPSSAVESRLSALTRTLVTKQNELEVLTTEKNALRLQLEKIEYEYRKLMGKTRKPCNVNDTDDAKAQVPTFLIETPFDTGVTRRVKRAYSFLDAVSIRTGLFLRRYPLARIFVFIYIGLLQFWVLVVLLFQSPDIH